MLVLFGPAKVAFNVVGLKVPAGNPIVKDDVLATEAAVIKVVNINTWRLASPVPYLPAPAPQLSTDGLDRFW